MLVYADEAELAEHVREIPDNAPVLLRYASALVRAATRFDVYDTTPAGAPSDPDVFVPFRDAVCVQVAEWIANEVDPQAGQAGVQAGIDTSSIAGGMVKFDNSHVAIARASVDALSPAALAVLRDEGLASRGVFS